MVTTPDAITRTFTLVGTSMVMFGNLPTTAPGKLPTHAASESTASDVPLRTSILAPQVPLRHRWNPCTRRTSGSPRPAFPTPAPDWNSSLFHVAPRHGSEQ